MQSGKKITLAMDTSASPLLLCAEKDGKIFSVRRKGVKQEKLLFPALQALLAKAGAELQDIGRIFIIRGPGRFTGIRISLTFASMLKYLNQTDVRGATVFDSSFPLVPALAEGTPAGRVGRGAPRIPRGILFATF